jgi:hypothetical protein
VGHADRADGHGASGSPRASSHASDLSESASTAPSKDGATKIATLAA